MIKILIADDHKLYSETLGQMLRINPDFQVIVICHDSAVAMETIKTDKPDIVLMDINIKPFSGIEATQKITGYTGARVIGLSMHSHPTYAKQMLRAGATGFITKNSPTQEIFTAIREVAKGNKYVCNETKNMISEQWTAKAPALDVNEHGFLKRSA